MKLDHVGLTVADLDALADWYAKAFDLSVVAAALTRGFGHIAFEVEDNLVELLDGTTSAVQA